MLLGRDHLETLFEFNFKHLKSFRCCEVDLLSLIAPLK